MRTLRSAAASPAPGASTRAILPASGSARTSRRALPRDSTFTERAETSALNSTSGSAAACKARTRTIIGRPLVDETGDDVAIAAADLYLRAAVEDEEAFAIGVRLDL